MKTNTISVISVRIRSVFIPRCKCLIWICACSIFIVEDYITRGNIIPSLLHLFLLSTSCWFSSSHSDWYPQLWGMNCARVGWKQLRRGNDSFPSDLGTNRGGIWRRLRSYPQPKVVLMEWVNRGYVPRPWVFLAGTLWRLTVSQGLESSMSLSCSIPKLENWRSTYVTGT